MNKLILIIIFILCFANLSRAQFGTRPASTSNKKTNGLIMLSGGIGFVTASILQSNQTYGTYITSNGMSTYSTPSFWQQTPRQVMFCVGGTLTITGLITLIANKR